MPAACHHNGTGTNANNAGIRRRYYISKALLQGRKVDAGSVERVSADEVERLVIAALNDDVASEALPSERATIDLHLIRATLRQGGIEIAIRSGDAEQDAETSVSIKRIAFTPNSKIVVEIARPAPRRHGRISLAGAEGNADQAHVRSGGCFGYLEGMGLAGARGCVSFAHDRNSVILTLKISNLVWSRHLLACSPTSTLIRPWPSTLSFSRFATAS